MDKIELKTLIRVILAEKESGAARKAHAAGLAYAKFGRWKDPRTGKVVAKSRGDTLIKVVPREDARELEKLKQIQKYQAAGRGRQIQQPTQPVDVPAGQTTQAALAQRKMQQKFRQQVPMALQPADIAKISPEWHGNFMTDLEDGYGFQQDDISPRVVDALYKKRLSPEDAAAEYFKIKNDVKQVKKKECQRLQGENIMTKGDLRKLIREIAADKISLIREKTGEHKDKSIKR